MSFLILVIIILLAESSLLYYLIGSEFFTPTTSGENIELWNIFLFLFLAASILGLFVTLIVYLGEKFLYCGWKEFPRRARSIKLGLIVFVLAFVLAILHTFHFLNFFVALLFIVVIIIGIMIIR